MPKITRATQKIFAQNGTDQLAAFGSMKTGTPIYTDNIEDLQTSDYEDGWENAIVADEAPFLEEMNGVQYGFSKQLAYLFQEGIAEYDAETTYYKNSIVKGVNSDGVMTLWYSLTDNNIGNNPADDTTEINWTVLDLGGKWGSIEGNIENQTDLQNELNSKLNTNQITNCITKIPQRINVELNNGTLTLKAGSVIIVPYGTSAPTMEIGDSLNGGEIVDISWDGSKLFYFVKHQGFTTTRTGSGYQAFLNMSPTGVYSSCGVIHAYSGSSAPSGVTNMLWYDTTSNIVKRTNNSGTTWENYYSLPFTVVTYGDGVVASIDNVFNGFGFIGSTIWCDKGVKGLAPDGRNSDGSLKNIEVETQYVTTNTRNWTVGAGQTQYATISAATKGANAIIATYYYEQEEKPDITGHVLWFNTRENVMYWQNNDNTWIKVNNIKVFNINNTQAYTDGKIDNISEVKQVFRAADYSSHPQITETYSNGASWYRVYSDGWCEQGGRLNTTGTTTNIRLIKPYHAGEYTVLATDTGTARVSYGIRRSTSDFTVYSASSGNSAYWTAKGYLN